MKSSIQLVALVFTVMAALSLTEARSFANSNDMVQDQSNTNQERWQRGTSFYYVVSEWSECDCTTGRRYRTVTCTNRPCHFSRAPRPVDRCTC